jgi:glycosyltransferase involved in cell wall biosynthesis
MTRPDQRRRFPVRKVFLLVNYTPQDPAIGITKKIGGQIRALRRLGYAVYYTAYEDGGVSIYDNEDRAVDFRHYRVRRGALKSLLRYSDLLDCASGFIASGQVRFDICYGRISATNRRYLRFLKTMKASGAKIILEALAYFPGVRMKTVKGKYIAACIEKNKGKLRQLVDKIITEGPVLDFYGIPAEPGKIGVDTDALPEHRYEGPKEELHMISVATELEYHAYDRLIRSLAAYRQANGERKMVVHLVGKLLKRTVKMIEDMGLQDAVIVHGRLYGEALYELYRQCNMGVGPLGQHRIGGKKDTGLKTKEYFGLGLPYFYSGQEADLPEGYPYAYNVPADESDLDFDAIWEFYGTYRDRPDTAQKMRAFARKTYSWDAIMEKAMKL